MTAVQADHEWRMCGAKVAYGSTREAKAAMRYLRKQRGTELRSYRCPYCGLVHLKRQALGDKPN